MVIPVLWNDPGLTVKSDPPRRARYPLLQSWYRETVLRVPPGQNARGQVLGNLLSGDAVARNPGLDFFDAGVASYVDGCIPIYLDLTPVRGNG